VLDDLGAPTATVVGASYGGLVGLAFAELFPERTSKLLVLCAGHRAHPMATGIRAIQRAIIRLGMDAGLDEEAVVIARALAMTTYRSTVEFEERFDVRPTDDAEPPRFPVEEYLHARGVSFASRFDSGTFYRLSESIDLHLVEPEKITARTTLLSVDTDVLAPPWLIEELEARAPGVVRHVRLESIYGHDAFLKEIDAVSDLLREELG
jgi:homoserine O-acetyltransferase